MRGMCSAVLFFEAIVFGLATPVMVTVYDVDLSTALWIGLSLATASILVIGFLSRHWGYWLGHGLQVAAIALGLVVPIMYLLGSIFAGLWAGAYLLGRKIQADKALDSQA